MCDNDDLKKFLEYVLDTFRDNQRALKHRLEYYDMLAEHIVKKLGEDNEKNQRKTKRNP